MSTRPPAGKVGCVALVTLIQPLLSDCVVPAAGLVPRTPRQSQSPAVNETEVISAATVLVTETAVPVPVMNSPTLPAAALSLVVVPGSCPTAAEQFVVPLERSAQAA